MFCMKRVVLRFDMKKKIIFVAQALWLGGIETALINLLNHLDYDRFEVTCLITEDYQAMAGQITEKCRLLVADRRHTVSFPKPYRHARLAGFLEEPQNASSLRKLAWRGIRLTCRGPEMRLYAAYIRKQLSGEHFDTCVIYSDRMAEIAVRAVSADRFLMFYHNADIGKAYHDTYGYRRSEKIIAVSQSQCEKLKQLRPAFANKMIAIPNYVDVDSVLRRAQQPVEQPLFPHDGIHLVSCGRLAYQKGFDIAIEACATIVDSGFENLHWYILGVGPLKTELERLAKEYGVQEHFHLIGSRNNPFPYMTEADLYVQPSRSEGYSLSILEARVLACPTVATYGAAGEQLEDGINGTLCELTADAISEAIMDHLRHPEKSESYRMALSAFSFERVNLDILSKIELLLDR